MLSDYSRTNADTSLAQKGISGLWFSSNPHITLDTVVLKLGPYQSHFSHNQAESGVSYLPDSIASNDYPDKLFPLTLQLKGRHILINSSISSLATGEEICYLKQDSILMLGKHILNIYCDGTLLEVLDDQRHICLGLYLEDSNVVRVKGYFVGEKRTIFIDDNSIKAFPKIDPHYQLNCDKAVTALVPRHLFR
jgi:hypothetical protein